MQSDSIEDSPSNLKSRMSIDFFPQDATIVPLRHFKLRLKYIISMLTFFFGLIGFVMNDYGMPDIATPSSTEHVGYEFNLTKFTVVSKENITKYHIKKYNRTIVQYGILKKVNYILNLSSLMCSFILLLLLYLILRRKNKAQEDSVKCNKCSFYLCLIYVQCEYIVIVIYIAMLIKLISIIYFITINIECKRIIMVTWNDTLRFLKQKQNIILLLIMFRCFNMIILIYESKMLLVLNTFFFKETKSEDEKEKEKESNIEMIDLCNKEYDKDSLSFMYSIK